VFHRQKLQPNAPLSTVSIARLEAQRQMENLEWKSRSLAELEMLYCWADGLYNKAGIRREDGSPSDHRRDERSRAVVCVGESGYPEASMVDARLFDRLRRCLAVMVLVLAQGACNGAGDDVRKGMELDPPRVRVLDSRGAGTVTVYEDTVPSCAYCALRLRPLAHFGSLGDSVLLRNIPAVERDSRGFFYATVLLDEDHELLVFDREGRLVRTVGRVGVAPGEFRAPWGILISEGDSLVIAHGPSITVFDSSGAYGRRIRLDPPPGFPQMNQLVAFGPGGLLASEYRADDPRGVPLHRYDINGTYLGGFGPPDLQFQFLQEQGRTRATFPVPVFATAQSGRTWIASNEYRIERVDPEVRTDRILGVLTPPAWRSPLRMTLEDHREFARVTSGPDAAAFLRDLEAGRVQPVPPPFVLRGLWEMNDSMLVALGHVASLEWSEAESVAREAGVSVYTDPGTRQRRHDSVIDILNVRTGALMARTRVRGAASLGRDGTVYLPVISSIGVVGIEAFEIQLVLSAQSP